MLSSVCQKISTTAPWTTSRQTLGTKRRHDGGGHKRTVGVYASSSDDVGGDDFGKLLLRSTASVAMFHNGLDKLNDTEGFAQFVVGEHLTFLPDVLDATQWTYVAAGVELVCPALLLAGFFARPAAFALFSTMATAVAFHTDETGTEGFPLAVVPQHQVG